MVRASFEKAKKKEFVLVRIVNHDHFEEFYVPVFVIQEFAKKLKKNIPEAYEWFRKLISWDGKPTKKCPVVGIGAKGASGVGTVEKVIDLNLQDKDSVEEFVKFEDEE